MAEISALLNDLKIEATNHSFYDSFGSVYQYYGGIIEATNIDVRLGELCYIVSSQGERIKAEVVGFKSNRSLLMPYSKLRGISINSKVFATGQLSSVKVSNSLLGRIVDAFGKPIDHKGKLESATEYPLYTKPTNPLERSPINKLLETGVKAIDMFTPIGLGQRIGIFAGSGVGKSTLLGKLAKNLTADVNVICLVGERGREVNEFLTDHLGEDGLARSVIITSTSDQSALERTHAAFTALSISEFFKDQGKDVLLVMDSVTRFAMAQREIGLAVGEPPTTKGYPPSVFSNLPPLLERAGNFKDKGSITAIYTVLVEGDDFNEPISDSMRSLIDGHIMLDRKLSNKGHYPPISVEQSSSRLASKVVDAEHIKLINNGLKVISEFLQIKDMVDIGAYEEGKNVYLDNVIKAYPEIESFLKQDSDEVTQYADLIVLLKNILRKYNLLEGNL
ncbi:FliI/YscN family ATPase [Kangiella sp. HZ709]|nr:FliI/YscN family ATPase [Kangiella sp. HZ709]